MHALADRLPRARVDGEERLGDPRVELDAGEAPDLGARRVDRHRGAIGAVGGHRVEGVHRGEDARTDRYRFPRETARVPRAVPALLVAVDDVERGSEEAHVL